MIFSKGMESHYLTKKEKTRLVLGYIINVYNNKKENTNTNSYIDANTITIAPRSTGTNYTYMLK